MTEQTVVIIGAGPAGLTAALEILRHGGGMRVVVLEASGHIGGISKTLNHKGYRIDIGGHRFFSKSEWVMQWWQEILPIADEACGQERPECSSPANERVLLVRNRLSRIFFGGEFFPYPLKADLATAFKLGPGRICRILAGYLRARILPIRPEANLEDFLVNRFGRALYRTFFKEYTEKVWGVPCTKISSEWGAQRIKGLSIGAAIRHAVAAPFKREKGGVVNQAAQTSLIDRFLYPKYGPGQMWETVAARVEELGGTISLHHKAVRLEMADGRVRAVKARDTKSAGEETIPADFIISTMPVAELIGAMTPPPPAEVTSVAQGLQYRDFVTVGLLLNRLKQSKGSLPGAANNLIPDNWIYIQDQGVKVGRLQIFNNWSPFLVADPDKVWIGMEYFCQEGDGFWNMVDHDLIALAIAELAQIGLAEREDLVDGVVIRQPKAYPGYFGSFDRFAVIREYVDTVANLFLAGRNGMHRYNNQDHSMLTARYAAQAILTGSNDKRAIWAVNIDDDYHEGK